MQTDKRVLKTRASIKAAFMELVKTDDMAKISVSALAAKALVNRSTFYLHYNDVGDVADDLEAEIRETISEFIDEFTVSDIYGSTLALFRRLTKRLEEKPSMKEYIFFSKNSEVMVARIKRMLVEKSLGSISEKFPNLQKKDILYPLTYAAAGIVDSYLGWVRNGGVSIEELIDTVGGITEHIIEKITDSQNS